jgi:integrase
MRKYAREAVVKYPSIARLSESVSGARRMGSINTVEAYVKGIDKFVRFLGFKDPEKALAAIRSGQVDPAAKVGQFIDKALEGFAHGTVRNYLFGIKKWFELSGVKVDWEKIEFPSSAETSESDRAPSKEELKNLLNHASSARDRAAIMVLTSSGLRIGTMLSLKVGDVDFVSYPDVGKIKVERKRGRKFVGKRRGSQGRVFFTWITEEAKKALMEYLEERKRAGEALTPESPLFEDSQRQGKFVTLENFERVWYRLLKRAGLNEKSNRQYMLHVHTLRKYFRSNCIGVDPSYRETWMGHKAGYLDASYFRAEEPLHLAEYRKAIPHLTIYSTPIEQKQLAAQIMKATAASLGTVSDEQLKRIDEIFARAKTIDEAVNEFRKFKTEEDREEEKGERKPKTMHDGNGKYYVAHNEDELIQRLHDGYKLIQSLGPEKFLLETAD